MTMVHAYAWAHCIYIFFGGFSQDLNAGMWITQPTLPFVRQLPVRAARTT